MGASAGSPTESRYKFVAMSDQANDQFVAQRFRFAFREFLRALKHGGPTLTQRAALGFATREAESLSHPTYAAIVEDCLWQEGYPLASHDRKALQREDSGALSPGAEVGCGRLALMAKRLLRFTAQ
jgi:hypothetical protein